VRTNKTRSALLCLVVLLTAALPLFVGCAKRKGSSEQAPSAKWFDETRERIRHEFVDPEQVVALTGVVDRMEIAMNDLDKDVVAYYSTLAALDRDYASTREQFQEVIDEFNATQRQVFDEMLGYAAEMKKIAGREGWKKLYDVDKMLYEN
jgi:hypothetical protein